MRIDLSIETFNDNEKIAARQVKTLVKKYCRERWGLNLDTLSYIGALPKTSYERRDFAQDRLRQLSASVSVPGELLGMKGYPSFVFVVKETKGRC